MTQHTSRRSNGYLTKKESDGVLHPMTWPPQSPDLNRIEMEMSWTAEWRKSRQQVLSICGISFTTEHSRWCWLRECHVLQQVYFTGHPQSQLLFERLSFQFSAEIWLERIAKINFRRLLSPSLTLSISCQRSLLIMALVHSPSVNSPANYLIPILLFIFCSFAPEYVYLHIIICTYITPVLMLNCNCLAIMAYVLPVVPNLTTFAHTVYRFFFCVIVCTFVYPMCNFVLFVSHCLALSWPGHSCKWELVLNWPTWLNKGEIKNTK